MSAYSDLILATPNLASYWRLGESVGTTATAAFGAITGTYSAVGVTYGEPGLLLGDPAATSVFFDHAFPGDVRFGDNYDFINQSPFSAEVWVKPFLADDDAYVWWKGEGVGGGWVMSFSTPTLVARRYDAAGANDGAFVATGLTLVPHHLVMTYNGTDLILYVDGADVNSVGSTRNMANTANVLTLGSAFGGSGFKAWFQDAAIYTAALSPGTVLAHYTAGMTLPASGVPRGPMHSRGTSW